MTMKMSKPGKRTLQRRRAEARDEATILTQAESAAQAVRESMPDYDQYVKDACVLNRNGQGPALSYAEWRAKFAMTPQMLAVGGKAAYESWVREAGYAKDARIMEYEKLKVHMHTRWERIAADVFKAMRGVG